MRKSILLSLLVLLSVALYAQQSPEQLGGVYYAYQARYAGYTYAARMLQGC